MSHRALYDPEAHVPRLAADPTPSLLMLVLLCMAVALRYPLLRLLTGAVVFFLLGVLTGCATRPPATSQEPPQPRHITTQS